MQEQPQILRLRYASLRKTNLIESKKSQALRKTAREGVRSEKITADPEITPSGPLGLKPMLLVRRLLHYKKSCPSTNSARLFHNHRCFLRPGARSTSAS